MVEELGFVVAENVERARLGYKERGAERTPSEAYAVNPWIPVRSKLYRVVKTTTTATETPQVWLKPIPPGATVTYDGWSQECHVPAHGTYRKYGHTQWNTIEALRAQWPNEWIVPIVSFEKSTETIDFEVIE
jgi:hypothetical protein